MEDFGIVFNQLYTITNMPISRFLDYLLATENYEDYMRELVSAYNPSALENVMCTNTLSVGWDGSLYDCDFNQMLNLKINGPIDHISGYKPEINKRSIRVSQHCYGCTAGAGSSCQGALNS
jgi:radical SAM/Cys-rich protein